MAWENRGNNRYYYRKSWENGTCVSQYIGTGPLAQAIDDLEQLTQQQAQFERQLWQAEQRQIDEVDAQLDQLIQLTRNVVGYGLDRRRLPYAQTPMEEKTWLN